MQLGRSRKRGDEGWADLVQRCPAQAHIHRGASRVHTYLHSCRVRHRIRRPNGPARSNSDSIALYRLVVKIRRGGRHRSADAASRVKPTRFRAAPSPVAASAARSAVSSALPGTGGLRNLDLPAWLYADDRTARQGSVRRLWRNTARRVQTWGAREFVGPRSIPPIIGAEYQPFEFGTDESRWSELEAKTNPTCASASDRPDHTRVVPFVAKTLHAAVHWSSLHEHGR